LNEIADSSGGSYIYARNLKDIPGGLKKIYRRITQCYVIRLEIEGVPADNLPHSLELTVDESEAWGRGAKTFIAVKNPLPRWVKWAAAGAALLFILLCVFIRIFLRMRARKRMGITRRRCPVCKRRMKDSWDDCPFCRYLPPKKQKRKKAKDG
jgi:hypothetical protein